MTSILICVELAQACPKPCASTNKDRIYMQKQIVTECLMCDADCLVGHEETFVGSWGNFQLVMRFMSHERTIEGSQGNLQWVMREPSQKVTSRAIIVFTYMYTCTSIPSVSGCSLIQSASSATSRSVAPLTAR